MRDAVTPALPVTDRDLERVLCGEAEPALVARVEALAQTHPALAAHLQERRAAQAAFRLQHPRLPAPLAVAPRSRFGAHALSWGSGALAAACAALFVVVAAPDDAVRMKGAAGPGAPIVDVPLVDVVVKRGTRVFRLQPGAVLAPGDALRLEVDCAVAAVVSVALHERDTRRTALLVDAEAVPAGRALLSGSFVLDAHVGSEELWVTCAPDPALAARAAADMVAGARPPHAAVVVVEKGP